MLGTPTHIIVYVLSSYVIFCGLIFCSAELDTHHVPYSQHRFYRSKRAAETVAHKAEAPSEASVKPSSVQKQTDFKNVTATNATHESNVTVPDNFHSKISVGGGQHNLNSGALLRGFYVFVGLSAIVVIYIVVRAISMRRKKTTVRKYGILANREDVEMTPLGAEDDEEDTTLFDVSNQTRR